MSTDLVPAPPGRAPSASACEPYREIIAEALARGRNAVAIWQDLVDDHGFPGAVRERPPLRRAAARHARRRTRASSSRPRRAKKARSTTATARWCATASTGKYRRTRLFVLTLGYSRKSVRLLTWRSSAQIWAELHERAFRRLGGTVRVIVLDNLKEGVLTPDIYDPALNPLYRDVLAHYGVVALPCRVGDPDRKGQSRSRRRPRAEDAAERTPLRDDRGGADVPRIAGRRAGPIRGSTARRSGRSPRCLPRNDRRSGRSRSNRFATTGSANARSISMAASKSRPPTTARRLAGSGSACTCNGMISTSACSRRRPASCCASICARRAAGIASTTPTGRRGRRSTRSRCWRARRPPARTSAPSASYIHQHEGAAGVRHMLGVLALAKKHGPAVVDDAAKAALDLGVPTYRFLRATSNVGRRCR